VVSLLQEINDLEEAIAVAEVKLEMARGRTAAREGEPIAWGEDTPEWAQPKVWESLVQDNLSAIHEDGELFSMDCDEMPCIASILIPVPEEQRRFTSSSASKALSDRIVENAAITDTRFTATATNVQRDGQFYSLNTFTVMPSTFDAAAQRRISHRLTVTSRDHVDSFTAKP